MRIAKAAPQKLETKVEQVYGNTLRKNGVNNRLGPANLWTKPIRFTLATQLADLETTATVTDTLSVPIFDIVNVFHPKLVVYSDVRFALGTKAWPPVLHGNGILRPRHH